MCETKDQLVSHLQTLIDKRLSEGKVSSVSSLVGTVTQFKQFREWLKNNFRQDLKSGLLSLIQEESHHFNYDFETGIVSNNNYFKLSENQNSTPIVLKPKLFTVLETNHSSNEIDNNLYVFELILFVINETKDKSVLVSDLIHSIEEKFEKQWNCFKSMIKTGDNRSGNTSHEYNQNLFIQLMTNDLKPFFAIDSSENRLTINSSEIDLSQVMTISSQTCLVLVKNSLETHLYRFGRKCLSDLNDLIQNKYKIISKFMSNERISLDRIIESFPEVFELRKTVWKGKEIDLKPKLMGKTRCLHFELRYKYGEEIRGVIGVVKNIAESCATIESKTPFFVNGIEFEPQFEVNSDSVRVLGQEVCDLRAFIHFGDRLMFDVKFVSNIDEMIQISDNLWSVSRIYDVKHSAICFVRSVFEDWKEWKFADNRSESSDLSSDDSL